MRARVLVLPAAALIIWAMVDYKLSQKYQRSGAAIESSVAILLPAPVFEGLDQDNDITRLQSYVGRHDLFVVFFDRRIGAGSDPNLQHLKAHSSELDAAGFRVVGVSGALPQENRQAEFPPLFSLVTDPEPNFEIHRLWGCIDDSANTPIQAIFHIDRAGNIPTKDGLPVPMEDAADRIDTLLGLKTH